MHYTPKQLRVMQYVRDYRAENLVSPTLEEIAAHLDVTKPTAFGHIDALIRKGALSKTRSEARSIEIADPDFREARRPSEGPAGGMPTSIPVLGKIAAGRPIEAFQEPEPIDLSELFPPRDNCYALRVVGDSMIEDGIRDGDIVIVERRQTAAPGETVVAVIGDDDEVTLKRFYRDGGRIRLQPANAALAPIIVDRCEIRGVVVSVHRRYRG